MAALQASLLLRPSPSPLFFFPPKPSPSIRLLRPIRHHRRRRLTLSPLRALSHSQDNLDPPPFNTDPIFESQTEVEGDSAAASAATAVAIDGVVEKESAEKTEEVVETVEKSRLPLVAFLIGALESARRWFDRVAMMEWLNWWPFWRREKRLERLMAEADANPKDAAKQSELLAELSRHRF